MSTSALSPNVDSVKTRLKQIWMAGDYDRFSRYMESGAREFYERVNVAPGCRLLDVGCGSGQLALMAAKDGLEVTGVDIAAKQDIYDVIRRVADEGMAILLISSELPEVIGMSDRVLVMRKGGLVGEVPRWEATERKLVALATGSMG